MNIRKNNNMLFAILFALLLLVNTSTIAFAQTYSEASSPNNLTLENTTTTSTINYPVKSATGKTFAVFEYIRNNETNQIVSLKNIVRLDALDNYYTDIVSPKIYNYSISLDQNILELRVQFFAKTLDDPHFSGIHYENFQIVLPKYIETITLNENVNKTINTALVAIALEIKANVNLNTISNNYFASNISIKPSIINSNETLLYTVSSITKIDGGRNRKIILNIHSEPGTHMLEEKTIILYLNCNPVTGELTLETY